MVISTGTAGASKGLPAGKRRSSDRMREPEVVRRRPRPDLGEELLDRLGQRQARPVEVPVQGVATMEERQRVEAEHRHLHVVRAITRRRHGQLAETCPRDARDHGAQGGVGGRRRGPLGVAVVGVAPHADDAVAPVLVRDPVEGVVAVVRLVDEQQRLALGAELPPHVLHDHAVPARGEVPGDGRHVGVLAVLVVRQPGQHGRAGPDVALGQVDVGREADPVAHAHHVLGRVRRHRPGPDPDERRRHHRTSKKRMQTCDSPPRARPTKTLSDSQRCCGASVRNTGDVR